MARYKQPSQPAMSIEIAGRLAEVARRFDDEETDARDKLTAAFVLSAINTRYTVSRPTWGEEDDVFDRAEAHLTARDEGE